MNEAHSVVRVFMCHDKSEALFVPGAKMALGWCDHHQTNTGVNELCSLSTDLGGGRRGGMEMNGVHVVWIQLQLPNKVHPQNEPQHHIVSLSLSPPPTPHPFSVTVECHGATFSLLNWLPKVFCYKTWSTQRPDIYFFRVEKTAGFGTCKETLKRKCTHYNFALYIFTS